MINEQELNKALNADVKKSRGPYTWRDTFMILYFAWNLLLALSVVGNPQTLAYNTASALVSSIGILSVIFKLKRLEGVMIVTFGLLLGARAALLMPYANFADNTSFIDFFRDVLTQRPLADGLGAFFPLAALAAYRSRRGRIQR